MLAKYVVGLTAVVVGLSGRTIFASPWDGAWTLDLKRSSADAADGAADGYAFSIQPDGRIRWEIPSLKEVVTGKTDGKPMAIRRPGAPADMMLSVTQDGPTVLRYKVTRGGKPFGEGRMTLIEDGKAWVDITWATGKPESARELVYLHAPAK